MFRTVIFVIGLLSSFHHFLFQRKWSGTACNFKVQVTAPPAVCTAPPAFCTAPPAVCTAPTVVCSRAYTRESYRHPSLHHVVVRGIKKRTGARFMLLSSSISMLSLHVRSDGCVSTVGLFYTSLLAVTSNKYVTLHKPVVTWTPNEIIPPPRTSASLCDLQEAKFLRGKTIVPGISTATCQKKLQKETRDKSGGGAIRKAGRTSFLATVSINWRRS